MAAISNIQLFTWMGIVPVEARNAVIVDFMLDRLVGLQGMTLDDVKETYNRYAKRTGAPFPILLTPLQKQRMRSLVLWVKDRERVQQPLEFRALTTCAVFIADLKDSLDQDALCSEQKKAGTAFLDSSFNNKLKSQSQWEKFNKELESTLSMVIGVNGIPLNYVIRTDPDNHFDPNLPYLEAVLQAVSLEGDKFKADSQSVHQMILCNVHKDSDAYTYIKSLLRYQNGRHNMMTLRERYSSDATKQVIINSAKSTLDNLRYKNEGSFSFERFSSKLQKAYDELEDSGCLVHNVTLLIPFDEGSRALRSKTTCHHSE